MTKEAFLRALASRHLKHVNAYFSNGLLEFLGKHSRTYLGAIYFDSDSSVRLHTDTFYNIDLLTATKLDIRTTFRRAFPKEHHKR
jgi:hypothetical protein